MYKYLAIAFVVLLAAGFGYRYYTSPSAVLERDVQHALDGLSAAVASNDRIKISDSLKSLLSDNAQIHLEINSYSMSQVRGKPVVQEFDKASFLSFVDNILYTLDSYKYSARVKHFTAGGFGSNAAVTFNSSESAAGVTYYSGISINMEFESETTCEGEVSFSGVHPTLNKATCKMTLRSLPAAGQESKLRNPDTLRELLR